MIPRIFVAALGAEVNSFSPLPIDRASFAALWLYPAGSVPHGIDPPLIAAPLRRARALAACGEIEVVEGLCAGAQPGGIIARATWEDLRDELLADLAAAGAVDAVILGLHGATIADGTPDCDGDLLARVRALVGPGVPVAALLDPHCNLSAPMLDAADLLVAYKEYPHDDIFAVADGLVDTVLHIVRGKTRPVMAAWDCRTIGAYPTYAQPMRGFVDAMAAAVTRDPALIDISLAHGFPWGDVAEMGTRVWVTADGDAGLAARTAQDFGERLIAIRAAAQPVYASLADAVAAIAEANGLVVLAETADNPGGGAPGDSTVLIRALRDAGIEDFGAALIWDAGAVAQCVAAGEGAVLPLRIGGKASALSGVPLDLDVRIDRIVHDFAQPFGGGLWPTGTVVAVSAGRTRLVLSATRTQCFAIEAFTALGIDPAACRVLLVKSSNHFEASFRTVAATILRVATRGVLAPDFADLPYRQVERPIWPLDAVARGRPVGRADRGREI